MKSNYRQFWPVYLAAHRGLWVQRLHVTATIAGALCCTVGAVLTEFFFCRREIVLSYAIAFASHFFIEKNRPTAFRHPLLSALADVHMCALFLSGSLDRELQRVGLGDRTIAAGAETRQPAQGG